MSTSDPNENNIEKNTSTPIVQHTWLLISPYLPKVYQFIVINARYVPMTPKTIPEAPQLIVFVLLHKTEKIFPIFS